MIFQDFFIFLCTEFPPQAQMSRFFYLQENKEKLTKASRGPVKPSSRADINWPGVRRRPQRPPQRPWAQCHSDHMAPRVSQMVGMPRL